MRYSSPGSAACKCVEVARPIMPRAARLLREGAAFSICAPDRSDPPGASCAPTAARRMFSPTSCGRRTVLARPAP